MFETLLSSLDLNGIDLTPVQDTPVASRKEDTYVHFNVDIELQKHVEKLTKGWFVMVNHCIGFSWPEFSSRWCFCARWPSAVGRSKCHTVFIDLNAISIFQMWELGIVLASCVIDNR